MLAYIIFSLVLVKSLESYVMNEYPLKSEGLDIDFGGTTKDTELLRMQVDVNEQTKTWPRLTRSKPLPPKGLVATETPTKMPELENRFGIKVGLCPIGYVKRGGFCFQDEDY